jgi:hypothetical protein
VVSYEAGRKEGKKGIRKKMKAQFFILGAILLCSLFFIGMPIYGPAMQASRSDLSFVSANVASELPRALNLGMKQGSGAGGLQEFSQFSRSRLLEQSMEMRSLWVVSEPQGSGLLVTAGNFMGQQESVTVVIGGSSRTFELSDGSVRSDLFPSGGHIRVEFPARSWEGEWPSGKVSLYAFTEIAKSGDVAVQETEA